jgi:hypothetical protein
MRLLIFIALSIALDFARAQSLSIPDAMSRPEAEAESRLAESHPGALYAYARRMFDAGRKDDAVMWFYAGQLRFRYHLKANPSLPRDGEPALMVSLNATVGQTINEWAGGSPRQWADSIQKALDWDAKSPNPVTPKEQYGAALADMRSGLTDLAQQIRTSEDTIRTKRKSRGLENR